MQVTLEALALSPIRTPLPDAQVNIAAKAGYAGVELLGDYKTQRGAGNLL